MQSQQNIDPNIETYRNEHLVKKIAEEIGAIRKANRFPDLVLRWDQIQARFAVYGGMTSYTYFNTWIESNAMRRTLENINMNFAALQELKINQDVKNQEDIEWMIHHAIDLELSRIELKQLRRLIKDQDAPRDETRFLEQSYRSKIDQLERDMRNKQYSSQFSSDTTPALLAFTKYYEKITFAFKRHLERARFFSSAINVAGDLVQVATTTPTVSALGTLSTALMAIPILGALATGIPIVLNLIRVWAEDKSPLKKTLGTVFFALFIGSIIAAGLIPVAAGGIACALIGIGAFTMYIKPCLDLYFAINAKQKEAKALDLRINNLLSTEPDINLNSREKNALLKKLEEHCAKQKISVEEIRGARAHILGGHFDKIAENNLIQKATGGDLKAFIVNASIERKLFLNTEIEKLKSQRLKQTTLAVNGILTLVGAILICIPFPPAQIAGASLIALTAIVNITVQYDLIGKAGSFFGKLFQGEKKQVEKQTKDALDRNGMVNQARPTPTGNTASIRKGMAEAVNDRVFEPAPSSIITPADTNSSTFRRIASWFGFQEKTRSSSPSQEQERSSKKTREL